MADMGTFRIAIRIGHPTEEHRTVELADVLVDTGSELTWVPAAVLESLGIRRRQTMRFRQATGAIVERATGAAIVHAAETSAADEVVFAEEGDMTLLGARSLEGLRLGVDPLTKRIVDTGPMPVAAAA